MSTRFVTITDPEEAARLGMAGLLWWDERKPDENEPQRWAEELSHPTDVMYNVRAGRYSILLED